MVKKGQEISRNPSGPEFAINIPLFHPRSISSFCTIRRQISHIPVRASEGESWIGNEDMGELMGNDGGEMSG